MKVEQMVLATLDMESGRTKRDAGIHLAEMAQWRLDKAIIDKIILMFADGGCEFTSDDVTQYLAAGFRPAAIGGAFLRAAKKGYIEERGWKHSERPEARSRKITVWIGTHVEEES